MASIGNRIKNAMNAFMMRDSPEYYTNGFVYPGSYYRPDRITTSYANAQTIVNSIYNQISVDASSVDFRHVKVDEKGNFIRVIDDDLNMVLSTQANIDQTGRNMIRDAVYSMLDEGCVALLPVSYSRPNNESDSIKVMDVRVGKIVEWYSQSVKIEAYNEVYQKKTFTIMPKRIVPIIENPFYSIMNEPNSILKRYRRVLSQIDRVNESTSSGKLDMIIQLPYSVRNPLKKDHAEERKNDISKQLTESPLGIAYIDSQERVIQLNRSVDNNLWAQAKDLEDQLFSALGLSKNVFSGTASELELTQYYNRTTEPILTAICEEIQRKWLSKTSRTQGQTVTYFRDPFKLIPASQISEMSNSLIRNTVMTANELRGKIGLMPFNDPKADELRNPNISEKNVDNNKNKEEQNEN